MVMLVREERKRLVYEVVRRRGRGESRRGIARSLGISPKTVRRMLAEEETRRTDGDDLLTREMPATRAPRISKLDSYADFITDLVDRYPNIRATRLLEELCGVGFDGGYTIVRGYLNDIRPKPVKAAAMLVETAPGHQAQVDWSPYKLADGTVINAFSCILSYSRFQYIHFCSDTRQTTIFRQMRCAMDFFGGTPKEYVFDSMPGIVDRWEFDRPILNLRAVDFATYYDFGLHIAPRYDGAYKGKVERVFRHMDESFFNARTFHTIEQANETLRWWLKTHRNERPHSRTRRRPIDVLSEEPLQTIPRQPYDDRDLAHRIVDGYSYVAFDGNWYRAPNKYIGQWVYVRASETEVGLIAGPAKVVVRHPRAPRNNGDYVPPPTQKKPPRRVPVAELLQCFGEWGPSAIDFAEHLCQRKRYSARELDQLLALRGQWSVASILTAIERAARYGAYSVSDLERILLATATPLSSHDHLAERARNRIAQSLGDTPVTQRGVKEYTRLLGGPLTSPDASSETDNAPENPSG